MLCLVSSMSFATSAFFFSNNSYVKKNKKTTNQVTEARVSANYNHVCTFCFFFSVSNKSLSWFLHSLMAHSQHTDI